MRYDRLSGPAWVNNLFRYTDVKAEYERRIDLIIDLGDQEREARLQKKYIFLNRKDKEVTIPEWLCEREGLV